MELWHTSIKIIIKETASYVYNKCVISYSYSYRPRVSDSLFPKVYLMYVATHVSYVSVIVTAF